MTFESRLPPCSRSNVKFNSSTRFQEGAATLAVLASPGADLKQIKGRPMWQMRVNKQYRLRFVVVRDLPLEVEDVWFGDPH